MTAELVVEDELSEVVLRKLTATSAPDLAIANVRITSGFGQIKKHLPAFNNLARIKSVLVLTDLDQATCAPSLIADWFGELAKQPRLIFRVAVREIESWVMADRARFAQFLGVQINLVPSYPDQLADPKATLLDLARGASKQIRKALLPVGHTAKVGPGYNEVMSEFVTQRWRPSVARENSPSLSRAMDAVAGLS